MRVTSVFSALCLIILLLITIDSNADRKRLPEAFDCGRSFCGCPEEVEIKYKTTIVSKDLIPQANIKISCPKERLLAVSDKYGKVEFTLKTTTSPGCGLVCRTLIFSRESSTNYEEWNVGLELSNNKQTVLEQYSKKGERKNGKKDGAWREWCPNGQLSVLGNYLEGKKHGEWTKWHCLGIKEYQGRYEHGQKDGIWKWWHGNGQLKQSNAWENGVREGKWSSWYHNGCKESESEYRNDKRLGSGIYISINQYTGECSDKYIEKSPSSENLSGEEQSKKEQIENKGENKKKVISDADIRRNQIRREMQKRFLYRIIDDIDNSITFILEDIQNIESRIESIRLLEPAVRDTDLTTIRNEYERHMKWLFRMKEDFELDHERYLVNAVNNNEWLERCDQMIKKYKKLQKQAKKSLEYFKGQKEKLVYYLERQKFLLDEVEEIRDEIFKLNRRSEGRKESIPEERVRLSNLRYKLRGLQVEMNAMAQHKEELYLHYVLLIEQLEGKRDWMFMKIDEYKVLTTFAKKLGTAHSTIPKLEIKKVISTYEKEKSFLEGEIEKFDEKKTAITPFGAIYEVDRFVELLDYYEQMKGRYYVYMNLLNVQIDGFNAELNE